MEKLKESMTVAWSNLATNPIRSALSVLGIVIGIAAVIIVLGLSAGARARIVESMNALGADVLTVRGVYDEKTHRIGHLEQRDVEQLSRHAFVLNATPQISLMKEVRSREKSILITLNGVESGYLEARKLPLAQGRFFSPLECRERARLCVMNVEAASQFFANASPLGQPLYVDGEAWTVIGVYGQSIASYAQQPSVLLPMPSLLRAVSDAAITGIDVQLRPGDTSPAAAVILADLQRADPNRAGLYSVTDSREFVTRRLQANRLLSLLGVIVAGVSLIVGGIGMMNVMLTSVAERTHEIGIRRAVGARKKDILAQFLVESCVLSALAGLLGLLLGAAFTRLFPMFTQGQIPAMIQANSLPIALISGTALGIIFGIYPAVKASSLSPAEALRSE